MWCIWSFLPLLIWMILVESKNLPNAANNVTTKRQTTQFYDDGIFHQQQAFSPSSNEQFYFDVDHDFGDIHNLNVRSRIPLTNTVSMLTAKNNVSMSTKRNVSTATGVKKDGLDADASDPSVVSEDLDEEDEMDSDDLEAEDNLEFYNEGASSTLGGSSELDDYEDEDEETGDSDEKNQDSNTSQANMVGSNSEGQDGTTGSMAGGISDGSNSGPDFAPTTEEEEGISSAFDDDDDDDEDGDEEESFDSDSEDDEDSDPEENDGGDFDSSDDGSEDDLESEEEENEPSYEYDDETEDSSGSSNSTDSDDDVLDQDLENEDGDELQDEAYEDNDDYGDGQEGLEGDNVEARNLDAGASVPNAADVINTQGTPNAQDATGSTAQQQLSPEQTSTEQQGSEQGGSMGGLKKIGRKIFGGRRKMGGRRIKFGGRKIKMGGSKIKMSGRKIRFGGSRKLRFGGRRKFRMRGGRKIRIGGHKGMGSKMIKMGGKMVRLPGRKIKIKVRQSMKIPLMSSWDWRKYIRGFKYESVGKANIGFLLDGTVVKHLGMMQRWIYNLILMFARGSYISVGCFGGSVNLVSDFKTFSSAKDVKNLVLQMKPAGGGRKIGEALEFYYPLYKAMKGKSRRKSILFLFARGKTQGDKKKMAIMGAKFRKLNVVIFVFGLGSRISISQFSTITTTKQRVMSARTYKAVILGGLGLRLGYRPGMARSIFMILQTRLSRWLGMRVGISSKFTTHHHGHSHKEWWFSKWDWYRYLGLKYGSLGRANLAFVIDSTNAELIMFMQRYVYNMIRLFQQQGTYVTIMTYGRNQYILTKWASFTSAQALQSQVASIPFVQTKTRNTAAALLKMLRLYRGWMMRKNAAKIPNILFLMSTGISSDRSKFGIIASMYKKLGIKLWTFGIGPEGKRVSTELRVVASSPRYAMAGDISGLIQKAAFTMVSGGLMKITGAGSAMQYVVGNPGMSRIQMKWNWRSGMRSIRYGYLSRANIGILVDGIQPKNYGYLRRFVYNLIRMYSLSGTYVSLMVYGSKVYRVSNFVQLQRPTQVRSLVMKMPKVANGARRTGAALRAMLQGFGDAPPGNPNILYLITQGPSADSVTGSAASLRKFGIKAMVAGIGPTASPKELATIAFSSSSIFKSGPNGLVHTLNNMQQTSASISGTVSKACGKTGHTRVRKTNIVKQWQWKTYGVSFTYSSVRRASVMFLIDGTNNNHFDVLQKLTYNIYKLFATGTSVSIITFGGGVDKRLAMFRTFTDVTAFQTYLSAMTYKGASGRKIGDALVAAIGAIGKAPGGKKILFVFATGKSDDDVAGPAKAIVNKGVSIFAIGIGKDSKRSEMKKISRYYLKKRWKGLLTAMTKIQNSLIKVVGRVAPTTPEIGPQPEPAPGDPSKKPPLPVPTIINSAYAKWQLKLEEGLHINSKSPDLNKQARHVVKTLGGFISSSSAQPIGLLQTKWDWYKMMKLKPQGLNGANVVILLDVSKRDNIDIMQRFIAQLIIMFKYKDTSFSLVTFSGTPTTAFSTKAFGNMGDVMTEMKKISARPSRKVKTGKALMYVKKQMMSWLIGDKQKVGILLMITRTKSSDDLSKVSEQIKGAGAKTVGIGIGGEISQEEIETISLNGQLGVSGPVSSLPALMARIMFGLTTIVNGPPSSPIMSLTTMAGKNGPALAGGVMNSVQTGSVPSETAGQTGTPNTGASAGDATGTDNGGGSAGAPEQGGASNPSNKPEVAQSETAPAGGAEVGGGETGAGGTDTSAGGGAAGATEAAAGLSKQDGGPGGPGDGTVTTGNSNKPVTLDGKPASSPTKPDGSPAPPTNPDGTPGVGPAKPDGTPVNPPAGTNPDGTPMQKPDGTPVEPAGSPPVNPDGSKPEVTKQNPDGSTTTDNPDGTKTTSQQDGSSTTTQLDGSAVTTKPDGTTLQKKPDGTVTTTKPDGSTSTSKVAADANPDGTPSADNTPAGTPSQNPDGSTTTANPDGSAVTNKPDGTTSETKPDGSTTTTKPDGSSTTTQPDGSATTTKPDGTTMQKQPDGTVTTNKPDGTTETSKVPPGTNPDGTPEEPPAAPGGGDTSTTNPDGSSTTTSPDGTSTSQNPDGSSSTTKPDGSETTTQPDGSSSTKMPDGSETATQPDGSAVTTKPDGTKMEKQPDGTVTTTKPDGSTETSNVAPDANPDGSPKEPATPGTTGTTGSPDSSSTTNPDGSSTSTNPDGSTTTNNPDGTNIETKPDGTNIETKPDGSSTETKPDGSSTEKKPDGSMTTTKTDGTIMNKTPDGTVTTTNPDGSTSTSNVPANANPDGSPTEAPPAAGGAGGTGAGGTGPGGTGAGGTGPGGTGAGGTGPGGNGAGGTGPGGTGAGGTGPGETGAGGTGPGGTGAGGAGGAGGCQCAGKCPPNCVPVMVTCKPNTKHCIDNSANVGPKETSSVKADDNEISAVQKLLDDFYDEDTAGSSQNKGK